MDNMEGCRNLMRIITAWLIIMTALIILLWPC